MKMLSRHILVPLFSPALFFLVVANPGDALSCRMRGLFAITIALGSILAGLAVTIIGAQRRYRKDPGYLWWLLSSLILAAPAVALILLA
jgi:hypothetical protein